MGDTNKDIAVNFLNLVIAGKIDEAYVKYVNLSGQHHNLNTPAGFHALKAAMKDVEAQTPSKKFDIKYVIGDKDMVAVYSHWTMQPDDPGMVIVHMFRFDDGKIVEFWDIDRPLPANLPNTDGAF